MGHKELDTTEYAHTHTHTVERAELSDKLKGESARASYQGDGGLGRICQLWQVQPSLQRAASKQTTQEER